MNNDKKLYLYSGLAIVGAVIAYFVITRKKPSVTQTNKSGEGNEDPQTTVAVSSTGEVIDQEQVKIDKELLDILKKTSAQATALLINKPIYTKLDNTKIRSSNYVNNGVVDNIMSTISNKGFLLGNVIQVIDDKMKLKDGSGRIYKWLKIKPAQITLDEMNRNKGFFQHVFSANSTGREIYVREDVVRLKK